jgi:hypothetical protein
MQVKLDGALRQPEAPSNFLVGNTLSEHQDYLALSLGQQEDSDQLGASFLEWRNGAFGYPSRPKVMLDQYCWRLEVPASAGSGSH